MALIYDDNIEETTTTTGTGAVTLAGATAGNKAFSAAQNIANNDTVPYRIADTAGTNWETGIGTYISGTNTLQRTRVTASSNSNALVSFAAGTKTVGLSVNAETGNVANAALYGQSTIMNLSGIIFDQAMMGASATTVTQTANRISLAPFIPSFDIINPTAFGAAVSTAIAGNLKMLIYDSDKNGKPNNRLFESTEVSTSTAIYVQPPTSGITMYAGRLYWIGTWVSATPTLRGVAVGACRNLGFISTTGITYTTALQRTVTYNSAANSAPNPWAFVTTDFVQAVAVSCRFVL